MDEIYVYLKSKLDEMRKEKKDTVVMDFQKVAELYQIVCFMKQIRTIVNWK